MRMPLGLRLKYAAGRYLPFLKIAPPAADRKVVFTLRPVRNAAIEWETGAEGEALLKVPRRKDRIGRVVGFWFRIPETRAVQLDEVGTFVWSLCDGANTVEGIVQKTSRQYKMNRREVEVSVTTYLQMLAERNFIGFYQRGGKQK
jgi:hypothetical protein